MNYRNEIRIAGVMRNHNIDILTLTSTANMFV
jgi:hypothetical protein